LFAIMGLSRNLLMVLKESNTLLAIPIRLPFYPVKVIVITINKNIFSNTVQRQVM
jgi:hypothetical protein